MASPKVPFKTFRILNLPSDVTRESLLKYLGLEQTECKLSTSIPRSVGIESSCQTVNFTIPEDQAHNFSSGCSVSIEGKEYLLDNEFEGFTPLCPTPMLEHFIEYRFSLFMQKIAPDFRCIVSLQSQAWLAKLSPRGKYPMAQCGFGMSCLWTYLAFAHMSMAPSTLQKSVSTARLIDYTDAFAHSLREYLQLNDIVSLDSSR